MRLLSLKYEENLGNPKEWHLGEIKFKNINLLVAPNATGKSRVLNIIHNIAEFTYNPSKPPYSSGKWLLKFIDNKKELIYEVCFKNKKISYELLKTKNDVLLERFENGTGKIKAKQIENDMLDFQISEDKLAITAKRDKLQHSFLEPLFEWGNNHSFYHFGKDMGQGTVLPLDDMNPNTKNIRDETNYMIKYNNGINLFGDEYKNSIINDMNYIGYDIKELLQINLPVPPIPMTSIMELKVLKIKEEDIGIEVDQGEMSQGMFRALSLIMQINYILFSENNYGCILIDDIGEGLDFNRAIKLIELLIKKVNNKNIQLIMSTNDRFIMNNTPLEYWQFLIRKGRKVSVKNYENSKEIFDNLYKSGLSNFDLFSSKLYLMKEK